MAIAAAGAGISAAEIPLLNDVVPGSIDFKGLPSVRSKSGGWKSASFIVGVEMAERFSYYGISSNLVSYLTGKLGQSTAAAAANLNAWYGMAALAPILGALLADSYFGRYRMIIFSTLLYILGLGFLTLSSALNSFDSSGCKTAATSMPCSPSQLQSIYFFFSLYLVALAQGGHKPSVQAFGADQFDVGDRKESEAKSSFFNWWFWFSCLGIVLAYSVVDYIQDNLSWELGFGIPSVVMCFALIVFWIGTMTYRFNINSNRSQQFVRRSRPRFPTISHEQEAQPVLPEECAQLEFLEDGLLAPDGTVDDEKMSNTNGFEEVKPILRLAPIWCTSLGYSIAYAQPSTLFTKQAATMDRRIGSNFVIPAASLQLCIPISIMVFVTIYDRVFVPIARSTSKNPSGISKLQRIGVGLTLSLISMVLAAVVERKRLAIAREYGLVDAPLVVIPMSVWWLAPQYLLSGISDVFGMIGLQEFFYDQVPSKLKSTGLALHLSILGIGSLASSFLISVIQNATSRNGEEGWFSDNLNRAHLDYFYWLLAGISALSFAAYVCIAKSYVYGSRIAV